MPATTAIRKRKQSYRNAQIVDVASIRYTQTSVKDTFSNGAPLSWTIYMLRTGQIKPKELPLIRVGCVENQWRTIDNRRLYCFKQAGVSKVPAIVMHDTTHEFQYKNQSYNDGTTITLIHDPPPNIDDNQMIMAYDPETSECKRWTIRTVIQQTQELRLVQNGRGGNGDAAASMASSRPSSHNIQPSATAAAAAYDPSSRSSSLLHNDPEEDDVEAPTKDEPQNNTTARPATMTPANVNVRITVTNTDNDLANDSKHGGGGGNEPNTNQAAAAAVGQLQQVSQQLFTPQPARHASLSSRVPYLPRTPQPGSSVSHYRPNPRQFLCKSRSTPFVSPNHDSNLSQRTQRRQQSFSFTPVPTTNTPNSKHNLQQQQQQHNASVNLLHGQFSQHAPHSHHPQQPPHQQHPAYAHPLSRGSHARLHSLPIPVPLHTQQSARAHTHACFFAPPAHSTMVRRYHSDSTLFALKKSLPTHDEKSNFGPLCSLPPDVPDEWSDDINLEDELDEKELLTLMDSNEPVKPPPHDLCLNNAFQMEERMLKDRVRCVLGEWYGRYGSQSQSLSNAFFDGIRLFMRQHNEQ